MIDLNGKLGRHERFRYDVVHIGHEQSPVLVIDDFLGNAQILADYAQSQTTFSRSDASYPGLRAPIPPIYSFALRAFLGPIMSQTFGLEGSTLSGINCGYALVTTELRALDVVQRMPHFDGTNPKQIALVHYLCTPEKGGTSFYRHRATGYETIDPSRFADYTGAVRAEIDRLGPPPPRYINGDDPMFERIAGFDAAFNRVLIYRSMNLHSAAIGKDFVFDANPQTGRLTANALFFYR
jgi:hypothetical protein